MASHTADGKYSYEDLAPNGYTLFKNADLLNKYLTSLNGWNEDDVLVRGMWGTDINICRIGHALIYTNCDSSLVDIARAAHDGWKSCYKYWLEYKPWTTSYYYYKPYSGLYSNEKPLRSLQSFDELPYIQKKIYRQIAYFIKYNCMVVV
jgi:hypothetical protein